MQHQLLQWLTALLVVCGTAQAITEAQLLPFGFFPPDLTLPSGNNVFAQFNLGTAGGGTLTVNGNTIQQIQVRINNHYI